MYSERYNVVNVLEGGCFMVIGVVCEEVIFVYEVISLVCCVMKVWEVVEMEMNVNSFRSYTLFLLYIIGVY